jgi:NADPH-dependent 2,4-dienoyl-CoA reductase/sulfur reductase-like enzyme
MFAAKRGGKKKVLVVGGGPAGLSAAKTAAMRGHDVTLYEKHVKLGGQAIAAGSLPYRADWLSFIDAISRDVKRLGVKVRNNTEFCTHMVKPGQYDAAIVAIGSSATRPNIPGANRPNVIIARDLIKGWSEARGKVAVVGGGCMGMQVAEALARNGHRVTVVELTDAVASDAPLDDRYLLLGRLAKLKVDIKTKTKVLEIGETSVTVQGPDGREEILLSDTVVLCLGSVPNDGVVNELAPMVKKVFTVGDAVKPRRVTEAVLEGALAALKI